MNFKALVLGLLLLAAPAEAQIIVPISQLPPANTLTGTELFPMAQNGVTVQGPVNALLSPLLAKPNAWTGANNFSGPFSISGNMLTLMGQTVFVGAFPVTFNFTAATNVTFPVSGTLATTGGVTFVACTNTSTDAGALMTADGATTGSIVVYPGTCDITSSISLTHALQPYSGAVFVVAIGQTLTLAKAPIASAQQALFSGLGAVHISATDTAVYAEWWGAKADNATASAPAFQAATNALVNGGTIEALTGFYQMACASADAVTVTTNIVNIEGAGDQATWFVPTTNCTHFIFSIAPSGQSGNIRDIGFNGSFIGAPYASHTWGAIKCTQCGVSDISHVQIYGSARGIEGDFMEDNKLYDIYCQGGAVFCYQFGGGPLDQTGGQHVTGLKLTAVNAFNLGNSAGIGFIFDSGSSDIDVDRAWQGGDAGGVLIQNTFSGTGAHRPEGIRIGEYSNFSANTNYALEVLSAWEIEFKNGANANGTTAGPDIILGTATGNPSVDGFAMDGGAWAAGAALNEIEIRAAANVSLRNSFIFDGSNSSANTYEAVHVTQYASGSLDILNNIMLSGIYTNLSSAMKWSVVLDNNALENVGSFVGRLHVGGNNMCGNSSGTIDNLGAAPTGANFQIDPDNLCDTTLLAVSRSPTQAPLHPGYVAVNYYSGNPGALLSNSGAAISANTLYAYLLVTPIGVVPTKLSVDVTSGVTGACHMGVYNQNTVAGGAGGTPAGASLNVDAGTISTTGTGVQELTGVAVAPTAKAYWVALLCNAAPSVGTLTTGSNPMQNWLAGQSSWGTSNQVFGFTATQSYGALPATFPGSVTPNTTATTQPAIAVRG